MNPTEQDLEQALRAAPQPKAPAGLEQKLLSEIPTGSRRTSATFIRSTWLQRWWPALAPAAVSLACAAVITGQQLKINDLTKNLQTLPEPVSAAVANPPSGDPSNTDLSQPGTADSEEAEIQRLKQVVANLSQEIERLERMKGENEKLRAQLTTGFAANITPQERENLQKLKEKANSTMCINNLKQIDLALHVWALDNQDAYPSNFLIMSNELSTPKILACPSDNAHAPASDWQSFGPGHCSYDYFVPLATEKPTNEPERVMLRCPIHGHIGLADGSVQGFVAKYHPERLVQRDGKLYYVHDQEAAQPQPSQQKTP